MAEARRLLSVDLLRGATMAAMIVVNNPGAWSAMYAPLRHAAWGATLTPADLVFPFFLFLVGVAVPLALGRRVEDGAPRSDLLRRAARRAGLLFAIGLFLNLFPAFDLDTLRIPGVLQRIAVVYLACAGLFLFLGMRGLAATAAALLAGYGALLLLVAVPGAGRPLVTPEASLPAWLDEALFGAHTWPGPGDPEGVLSSLGAVATGLVGVCAGIWLRRRPGRGARLAAAGCALLAAGLLGARLLPVAKEIWTPPYALITAGWALLLLAALHALVDGRPSGRGTAPLRLLGRQALTAYVLAHLLSDLTIHVLRWPGGPSLHVLLHRRLLASWLPPEAASLAWSLVILALVLLLVRMMERRGLRLRV